MELTFSPIDKASAIEISTWNYEPPYDIYNLDDDDQTIKYILDPQWNFYTIKDDQNQLVGFCSFSSDGQVPGGDYSQEGLDIGMGIHPDLTGKGFGAGYTSTVLKFAGETFNPSLTRVTIARFNRRAQLVWERNGFQYLQQFTHEDSGKDFLVYIHDHTSDQLA